MFLFTVGIARMRKFFSCVKIFSGTFVNALILQSYKNHDFRLITRFFSEMMQDTAIVTMESEYETAFKLSNGTSLNDLE